MSLPLSRAVSVDPALADRLGAQAYTRLTMIVDRLPALIGAPSLRAACKKHAGELPGITWRALENRVRAYMRSGNVSDLVDRRECPALWDSRQPAGLPAAFKEWYRGIREKHQRVAASAHAELIQIWRTHYDAAGNYVERITGYEDWPAANPATGVPDGWSYDNLQRAVPEHPWDAAAARQGLAAASSYRPPVRTTRVGLRIGERVEFDDHVFDVKCHFAGQTRAMRPVCFGGIDGLTSFAAVAVRPTLWDDLAEAKRTLTEFQFRCFVTWWLAAHGYRDDEAGTTLFTERGTAVIREDFERRLAHVTGGRVRVSAGSIFGEAAHPGQYTPRGKGNFRHKAAMEGFWSIVENWLDRLPGRTGSNQRLNGPADLHGREAVLAKTLALMERLPADLRNELILPVMTFRTFARLSKEGIEAILQDREHDLEGWEECGFTRLEWRSSPDSLQWLPQDAWLALPEPERMALAPRLQDPELALTRCAKLSRHEAWARHRDELTRLSPRHLCRLMDPGDAIEVTIGRQSLVEFTDTAKFGPGVWRFLVPPGDSRLMPGERFAAFFNPLMGRWLQLVDAKGAHVATLEAWESAPRGDLEQIKRQMGKQSAWEADRKGRLASRHFDEAEQRAHAMEHNRIVADRARQAEEESDELDRLKERAARAGRTVEAPVDPEVPIEGEVIDEVIERAPVRAAEDLGEVEHIAMPGN